MVASPHRCRTAGGPPPRCSTRIRSLSWVVLALVVVFVAISFSLASVRRRRADSIQTAWATGDAMPPSAAVRAPLKDPDAAAPPPPGSATGPGVTWHNGTEWREGGAPSAPWTDPYAGSTPIRLADGARPREARAPLDTPAAWHRAVDDEDARVRRYGRPATIVVIEVEGIDKLTERLGDDVGDRLLPAIAEAIRRETRGADRMAWLDRARFGVLLPETDEVAAVNFVERVRERCDLWLAAGAVSLRLVIGWASPAPEQRLADVVPIARRRLDEDRRVPAEGPVPARHERRVAAGAPTVSRGPAAATDRVAPPSAARPARPPSRRPARGRSRRGTVVARHTWRSRGPAPRRTP